jgi:hypothetical protein
MQNRLHRPCRHADVGVMAAPPVGAAPLPGARGLGSARAGKRQGRPRIGTSLAFKRSVLSP